MIVGFRGHRNDGLGGEFGIGFLRCGVAGASRVERRQVLRGLVINDLGMVETGARRGLWLQREETGKGDEQDEGEDVACAGFQKAQPRQAAAYKHIRPERRRSRPELKAGLPARKNQVAEIRKEDTRPGWKFD